MNSPENRLKGFEILKSGDDNVGMKSRGYVITASISSIKNIVCDEVWQITHSGKNISGALWVPELAPSRDLYNQFIAEWKDKPGEEWWPTYKNQFEQELKTRERLVVLRNLRDLVQSGKVIALVCFCKDNKYCHRSLVGDFLKQYGIKVEEYKRDKSIIHGYKQLALFEESVN